MSRSYAGAVAVLVLLTVLSTVGCGSHRIKVLESTVTPAELPADRAALRVRVVDADGKEMSRVWLSIQGGCLEAPLAPYRPPREDGKAIYIEIYPVNDFPDVPACSGLVLWVGMNAALSRPLRFERCRPVFNQFPLTLAPGQRTELTLRVSDFPCDSGYGVPSDSGSMTSEVEAPNGPVPKKGKSK